MKCFILPATRFRRRICFIMVSLVTLSFINLLLCTWKDTYWQDEEFELYQLKVTYLWKRRNFTHKLFTSAASQPKTTQEILHHSSLQKWTKRATPKPTTPSLAIRHSTVWKKREKSSSPVYHTRLRKQARTQSVKEEKQFIVKTQTVPAQKGMNGKVRKLFLKATFKKPRPNGERLKAYRQVASLFSFQYSVIQ